MRHFSIFFFTVPLWFLLPLTSFAQKAGKLEKVEQILFQQAEAWNRGDIHEFMQAYWKSDKLQFGGGSGITYGWQNTLNRYLKTYPDQKAMGQLTFEVKNISLLSRRVIMLVGSWELAREKDNPGGHFMLIWKKIGGKWVIIADHTSSR